MEATVGLQRQEVVERLMGQMDDLRRRGVKALAVFGSVARDQATAASDVDLLVEFESPVGLFDYFRLQHHLESLLGVEHVDLVMPGALKPGLRERILSEAIHVA